MRRVLYIALVVAALAGCGDHAAAPGPSMPVAGQPQQPIVDPSKEFYPDGDAWSVPAPEPREPVMVSDYQPVGRDGPYAEHPDAMREMRLGDSNKSAGKYAEAEQHYLAAIKLLPKFPHAAHQLACAYHLLGQPAKAKQAFGQAFEMGMADYPYCYQDQELGSVRAAPDFPEKLKQIRERYLAEKSLAGTPIVVPPQSAGQERAPIMFLLHGYGDSHESYLPEAKKWAELGYVAVAVPGSIPQLGGFSWSQASVEVTHTQLQRIVAHPLVKERGDAERVMVLGFSQGGMHALQIAMLHPESYRGAVPIGPGGRPWSIPKDFNFSQKHRPKYWFVYGEQEGTGEFVAALASDLTAGGWPNRTSSHPGGHHFPNDWNEQVVKVSQFLLEK